MTAVPRAGIPYGSPCSWRAVPRAAAVGNLAQRSAPFLRRAGSGLLSASFLDQAPRTPRIGWDDPLAKAAVVKDLSELADALNYRQLDGQDRGARPPLAVVGPVTDAVCVEGGIWVGCASGVPAGVMAGGQDGQERGGGCGGQRPVPCRPCRPRRVSA